MHESFQSMPFDRAVFEHVPSPTLLGASCLVVSGGETVAVLAGRRGPGSRCFKGSR